MKTQSTRARLLTSSMICGAAAIAFGGQAFAQDTQVEELVVTGSRIPQPNLTSTSPITVLSDQEAKLQGTTNVEDLVNSLPQSYADQDTSASNGATGTATVDLRGLGPQRTLVLVDGKRMMPGDPIYPYADLNNIPAALVDRVEVVTGGASAVYGSDALSGVVNFIMKKDFEGVRLDAQYSFATHKNNHDEAAEVFSRAPASYQPAPDSVTEGATWDLTAVVGVNSADGRGNATLYAGYRHQEPVLQSQYDYSACGMATQLVPGGGGATRHVCQGSTNYARIISLDSGADLYIGDDGVFSPFGGQTYNFGPLNYLQRPDQRYTLGGFAHYEINPMFDVYLDTMFADDHTVAQIAPSGAFLDRSILINCDNPLMSAQQRQVLCTDAGLGATDNATVIIGRRNIEGGNRQADLRHTAYRIVLGSRGELGGGWRYDIFGQYGTSIFQEAYRNEFSSSRFQRALQVVDVGGTPTCKSVISGDDGACVPIDIFGGFGAYTPDQLAYVGATGVRKGYTEQQVVSGSITGDLGEYGMKSPWASEGIGIALGVEYRREAIERDTDFGFQIDDYWGQGGPSPILPLQSFDVKEIFGEARIPIAQDMTFFNLLTLEAGYRHSDYSSTGETDAWKLALDWKPIEDIRFRAGLQRAVRAPNTLELFFPQSTALFGFTDPCAGTTPTASQEQCARTGVTAAQYGTGAIVQCPAGQCKQLLGGNPNLTPEEGDTFTVGVVFTPTFFRGFNMSVDYYDMEISNVITTYGANTIFNGCLTGTNPDYCPLVQRDANGFLFTQNGYVVNLGQNIGRLKAQGIDVEANYRTSFADMGMGDWGSLSFNFAGTRNLKTEVTPNAADPSTAYDCVGLYGTTCGVPYPEWRHRFRVTWGTPWDVQVSLNWRYIGATSYDGNDPNPNINTGAFDSANAEIKAYNYFDLAGTWAVRDGTTIRFGLNNIFDKEVTIIDYNLDQNINGNTYPQLYDALGRTWFIGVTADF